MKTTIEDRVKHRRGIKLFSTVAVCCAKASDEDDLRERLKKANVPQDTDDYRYGFGHHHFWFSERIGAKWNRLIIVEF